MNIVINVLPTLKSKTGVGYYISNLLHQLTELYPHEHFLPFPDHYSRSAIAAVHRRKIATATPKNEDSRSRLKVELANTARHVYDRALQMIFATSTRWNLADLYHEPNFMLIPSHLPSVLTVHDLSVVRFPQWHPESRVRTHGQYFEQSVRNAAHIIVVSEYVKKELIEYYSLSADRVTSIHNGVDARFFDIPIEDKHRVRVHLKLPEQFFLCVGTIEPRKNLLAVMRAFVSLPASIRDRCPLIIAGPWGWKSHSEHEFYLSTAQHAGVRHLGYIPDDMLPALYAYATALLYPSFYEGFGLPPLEMLATGGVVVASTSDAVREVCHRHAFFIDPLDHDSWRREMQLIVEDKSYRASQRTEAREHAARMTWSQTAIQTMNVYRKVYDDTH